MNQGQDNHLQGLNGYNIGRRIFMAWIGWMILGGLITFLVIGVLALRCKAGSCMGCLLYEQHLLRVQEAREAWGHDDNG